MTFLCIRIESEEYLTRTGKLQQEIRFFFKVGMRVFDVSFLTTPISSLPPRQEAAQANERRNGDSGVPL